MAVIRFEESLHQDPRVCQVGTEAFGLWMMSVGYVTRNCCEVYPHSEVLFTDSRGRLAPLLIAAGFWEWAEDDGGYVVLCPTVTRHSKPAYTVFVPQSDVPPEIRRAVFARDGHVCLICGATEDLTLDHIWPQVLGGEHTLGNLRVLCRSCNSRKGARV